MTDLLSSSSHYRKLEQSSKRLANVDCIELLDEPNRFDSHFHTLGGIHVDSCYQLVDDQIVSELLGLATELGVATKLREQIQGEVVNPTESRTVQHTAARFTDSNDKESERLLHSQYQIAHDLVSRIRSGELTSSSGKPFTDVIYIGIGGSYLGPALVSKALGSGSLRVHFISGLDSSRLNSLTDTLNPEETLVITASKSFKTPETATNSETVFAWLQARLCNPQDLRSHRINITSKELDESEGINLRLPESVGGRFSLWSAMGLPIMLQHGSRAFAKLLEGAAEVDQHVLNVAIEENIPLRKALFALWNSHFLGVHSHVVATYVSALHLLMPYLQQLELESNGKSVDLQGEPVTKPTAIPIWGGIETDGQHAWHQFLLQGNSPFSIDFVATTAPGFDQENNLANCLAQHELMFLGTHDTALPRHREVAKGHPCDLTLLDEISPKNIGRLLALYEHKVSYLSYLLNINAFDQFGVEHGKVLATKYVAALSAEASDELGTTAGKRIHKIQEIRASRS